MVTAWLFSGWPQIFNFPPKIPEAHAWTVDGLEYETRRLLTIDETKIDSDLVNFPVRVSLASFPGIDLDKFNSDGYDIRFTQYDGTTLLSYERETFNQTADTGEFWVEIPNVRSTASDDNKFYMYYRTTDTPDGDDTANVWDASFLSIYHLEHTSGNAIDTKGNDDASEGIDPDSNMDVAGKIARGDYLDGDDDLGIDTTPNPKWDCDTPFTYEAWIRVNNSAQNMIILEDGATQQGAGIGVDSNGNFYFGGYVSASHKECISTTAVDDDSWHHVVGINESDNDMVVYVDGELETTTSGAGALSPGSNAAGIGYYGSNDSTYSSGGTWFIGYMDEIRISSVDRGAAWVKATYNSGNNTLLTYGSEEGEFTLTQNDWRWYENADNVQPGTAKANENTAITGVTNGEVLRIRMNLTVGNGDMSADSKAFKLQYGQGTDCTAIGTWNDVGAIDSGTIWRGYNNSTPADGATIGVSDYLLSTSDVAESYEEANNSVNNPRAINNGQDGEWDWVVQENGATANTSYCFRMVKSDGASLDTYNTDGYPKLTTLTSATWREDEDTPIPTASSALSKNTNVRLRIEVANTGFEAENYDYRLEYGVKSTTCADITTWVTVPDSPTTEHFDMTNSTYFVDGCPTTARLANSEGYTFVTGKMVESPSNSSGNITLPYNNYTEIEFVFQANNNATDGGTYCFRLTKAGTALDNYSIYPQVQIAGAGAGINISGTVYLHNETTQATSGNGGPCDGSTANLSLRVNGGTASTTTCSSSDASFTFSNISANAGDTITIYQTSSQKTNRVYVSDGSNDTGMDLYIDTVAIGDEQDGTVTILDLLDYDYDQNSDDMLFDADDATPDTLTVNSGKELHIHTGDTFDPGGTVTTQGTDGDLHIDDNATCQIDDASSAISEDVLVDGGATFSVQANVSISGGAITTSGTSATVSYSGTPTVTISGTGSIGGGTTPSVTFYNLTISGTQTMASATTTDNDLTVNGTIQGSAAVTTTVKGNFQGTGTVNMTGGTVEQRVDGTTKNFGTTSGTNNWTFNDLTFSNSHASTGTTIDVNTGGTGSITVTGTLLVSKTGDNAGTTLQAGNRTWTLSNANAAKPFNIDQASGALTAETSTFEYTGDYDTGNVTIENATYNNLTLGGSVAENYNPEGAITASNDLTINTNSTLIGTQNITVNGGNATGGGVINLTGGTFLLDGTGNFGGTSEWTFYNLTFGNGVDSSTTTAGSTGTTIISNFLTIAANQTLNAGSKTWDIDGYSTTSTPFVINGVFNASTSTFRYTTDQDTNITATTYYNLELIDPPDTEILRPNAAGDYTNIASQYPDSGAHWEKVDEATVDDDDYVYTSSGTQEKDAYNLDSTAIPSGSTINSVTAFLRIRGLAQPFLRLSSTETEGTKVATESPSYGGTIMAVAMDDTYLYIGGSTTETVRKYKKSDLSYVGETADYGGTVRAIAIDSTHIYVGGPTTEKVRKYLKSDLSYVGETAGYGGTIRAIAVDDTHIYVGGEDTETVRKYLKSDLSYIGETPSYNDDIMAVAIDDTYVFAGGSVTNTVRQYLKSDLSYVDETASYGGNIFGIAIDDTHVYAGGAITNTIRKYLKSDLSYVGETPSYGNSIFTVILDSTYIYAGGYSIGTVRQYLKSDLSYVDETANYGTQITGIAEDDTYIYVVGTTQTIRKYWKSDLSGAWITFSEELARPGGGSWQVSDLNSLQVAIGLQVPASEDAYCTQAYVEVDYTPEGGPTYTLATTTSQTLTANNYLLIGNGTDQLTVTGATNNPILDVNGNFTISANATFIAPTSSSFTVGGSWANSGTFTHNSGTVTFDSSAGSETINTGGTGTGYDFANITFNNSGGDWTISTNNLTATGNFNLTNVTAFDATNRTITVQGEFKNDVGGAATTWTGSTLILAGSGSYCINTTKNVGGDAYATFQVNSGQYIRMWDSSASTYTINGTLYSMDHAATDGDLYIWGAYTVPDSATDYWSYAKDFDSAAVTRQCNVIIQSGASVTVGSGEDLEIKGGETASGDKTTVTYAPASGSWNFNNNTGSELTFQEATIEYLKVNAGTVTVLNTTLNSEVAPAAGAILNVDWYLGVHVVDELTPATDIDTGDSDVTISENSGTPASTVYKWNGSSWAGPATSQTTGTESDGEIPQPEEVTAGAVRIREYKRESTGYTYYLYNMHIDWQADYGEYDYYDDYGGKYLTSTLNTASGHDECISESWQRNNIDANNTEGTRNEPPTTGTWYVGMLNGLSFSIDSFDIDFGTITPGGDPTNQTNTLTVTTSATNGYLITAWSTQTMTCSDSGQCGSETISDWSGTNASPTTWSAGSYGFGYSTNDTTLTGGTADRFSGPKFAGFVHSGSGDPVADRSNTECPCNNQQNTITYRIAAQSIRRPGPYETTVVYICTANY